MPRRSLLAPPTKRAAARKPKPAAAAAEARPAQFASACCLCGGKVSVGDLIYRANRRTEHQGCAEQARQALAALGDAAPVVFYREKPPELGQPLRLRPGDGDEGTEGQVVVPLVHRRRFFRGDGLLFGLSRPMGWLYTIEARPASADEVAQVEQQERPAQGAGPVDRRALWRSIERRILDEGEPSPLPAGRQWPPADRRQPHHSYLALDERAVWLVRVRPGGEGPDDRVATRLLIDGPLRADLAALGALGGGDQTAGK